MSSALETDLDLGEGSEDGYMSGTFRWKKTKKLLSMPKVLSMSKSQLDLDVSMGWMEYFFSRAASDQETLDLITKAKRCGLFSTNK